MVCGHSDLSIGQAVASTVRIRITTCSVRELVIAGDVVRGLK